MHRLNETVYFEIPDSLLGRDMLLVTRIARVPVGFPGYSPAGVKTGEQVLALGAPRGPHPPAYRLVLACGDDTLAISISSRPTTSVPIVAAFDVEVESENGGSAVIDVTDFYEGDTPALTGLTSDQRSEYGVRRLDPERSLRQLCSQLPPERRRTTHDDVRGGGSAGAGTGGQQSMEMHQSMILLPAEPLRPRYADSRVAGSRSRRRTSPGRAQGRRADLHPPVAHGADRPGRLRPRRAGRSGEADRGTTSTRRRPSGGAPM